MMWIKDNKNRKVINCIMNLTLDEHVLEKY